MKCITCPFAKPIKHSRFAYCRLKGLCVLQKADCSVPDELESIRLSLNAESFHRLSDAVDEAFGGVEDEVPDVQTAVD